MGVELIGDHCCGRAAISKGRLDAAGRYADAMTARLHGLARQGATIVGVEPSCVLTLAEEHLALQPASEEAKVVASRVRLADELILDAFASGHLRMNPASQLVGRRFLFHGHCHQKALAGTAASVRLLSLIPGSIVVEVDGGCCGMAGSFGFEAQHYDLSMRIGGMRLFPAVNSEDARTLVAATGVSCRQQIEHGTGRRALHPVEYIWAAVLQTRPAVR